MNSSRKASIRSRDHWSMLRLNSGFLSCPLCVLSHLDIYRRQHELCSACGWVIDHPYGAHEAQASRLVPRCAENTSPKASPSSTSQTHVHLSSSGRRHGQEARSLAQDTARASYQTYRYDETWIRAGGGVCDAKNGFRSIDRAVQESRDGRGVRSRASTSRHTLTRSYTRLTLQALSAAIPQALLLLHALMDILPYPKGPRGLWYEIRTGTVECADEITKSTSSTNKGKEGGKGQDLAATMEVDEGEFAGIGGLEVDEPERVVRQKVRHVIHSERAITDGKVVDADRPLRWTQTQSRERSQVECDASCWAAA